MTELFRPFKESLSHFKNSSEGPGAEALSSFEGVDLTATAAGRAAVAVAGRDVVPDEATTAEAVGTTFADAAGVAAGRAAPASAAAALFPFAPTVVHAPPVGGVATAGCKTISN